ncbi:MAG: hypothetical protein JO162_15480 [Alphaproteobacteria bacterium]|nr:hypothetical protein [Alphaproteobacteria bacterium]
MDRTEFVRLGYAYADEQCDQFFIALQIARNKNSYDAAELSALNTFVTPGMGLLHAGAKAVGIVGGLFGFGTASLLNYSKFMLLTEYNAELQDLVHSAMSAYKKQVEDTNLVIPGMSLYDAYAVIAGYAWQCTLPGIDSLARTALSTGAQATAPLQKTPAAGAAAANAAAAAVAPAARFAPAPPRLGFAPAPPPPPPPPPGFVAPAPGHSVIPPQITVIR